MSARHEDFHLVLRNLPKDRAVVAAALRQHADLLEEQKRTDELLLRMGGRLGSSTERRWADEHLAGGAS